MAQIFFNKIRETAEALRKDSDEDAPKKPHKHKGKSTKKLSPKKSSESSRGNWLQKFLGLTPQKPLHG